MNVYAYDVNWPEARSRNDNRFFDYVLKRYQAFRNLVLDISKEALGYGHNDVTSISDRIDRLRSLDPSTPCHRTRLRFMLKVSGQARLHIGSDLDFRTVFSHEAHPRTLP